MRLSKCNLIPAIGLAVVLALLPAGALRAQTVFTVLDSVTATAFNGSTDLAALGADETVVSSGTAITVSNVPCMTVTATNASGLALQVLDQGPGWGGNFAPGTPLLWTGGAYQGTAWEGNGPLTLTFNTVKGQGCSKNGIAVGGVGFQIQSDYWGPFTATVCAYGSSNNLLFCNTFSGTSNFNSDNSAIFVGLLAPLVGPDIAKITISSSDAGGSWLNDFAISGPMIAAVGSEVPSGLVGWWLFDDGYGITAADTSGGDDNGTLQGAAVFANDSQMGNVLDIDGVSGQVDMAFSANLEPAIGTVSIWVNPSQAQNADVVTQTTNLLLRVNQSGTFDAYSLGITNTGEAVAILANDNPKTYAKTPQIVVTSAANTVNLNQWTNLVMRWNGNNLALFINGVKIATAAYDAELLTGLSYHGTAPLKVAATALDLSGNTLAYSGELSDLRIYSIAMTDAEILQLYSGQSTGSASASAAAKARL
jgi:hypothetical protein